MHSKTLFADPSAPCFVPEPIALHSRDCWSKVSGPCVQVKWCPLIRRGVQVVRRLQGDLPVWVRGDAWETAGEELDDVFIGDAEIWCGRLRLLYEALACGALSILQWH